jgi:hypothetical protein
MEELLNHPAVQGGVVPFVAAIIIAELFQRLRLSGLAVIAGFAAMVYLASDFSYEPLTATRKVVWLGMASAVLALPLMFLSGRWVRFLLAVAGGIAAVWVLERILRQQELQPMMTAGAGCAFYLAWLVFWMEGLNESSIRAGSAGLALGVGTGASALLGASGLLGQFGLSLGAASGAYLLIQMISRAPLPCGRTFTLPLTLIAGLSGVLAVMTADMPWYVLSVLGAIPLAAKIPVSAKYPLWLQAFLLSIVPMLCAAGAVYLTWKVAGAPPL